MARTHDLKTWPEYFEAILDGDKSFELRRNDRDFHAGDHLHLREWDPDTETYTGREITADVPYVLLRAEGLMEGYVILAIVPHLDEVPR